MGNRGKDAFGRLAVPFLMSFGIFLLPPGPVARNKRENLLSAKRSSILHSVGLRGGYSAEMEKAMVGFLGQYTGSDKIWRNISDKEALDGTRLVFQKYVNEGEQWIDRVNEKRLAETVDRFEYLKRKFLMPGSENKGIEGISPQAKKILVDYTKNTTNISGIVESMQEMISYIESLSRLKTPRIKTAFLSVDRQDFSLSPVHAYSNLASIIGIGSVLASPWWLAEGLERLRNNLRPGCKVLIIGGGSGYEAAVVGRLVEDGKNGKVISLIEEKEQLEVSEYNLRKDTDTEVLLEDQVISIERSIPMHAGAPEQGPFDAIFVTQLPSEPFAFEIGLSRQLTPNGTMIVPIDTISQAVTSTSSDDEDRDPAAIASGAPSLEKIIPKERRPVGPADIEEERERSLRQLEREEKLERIKKGFREPKGYKPGDRLDIKESLEGYNNTRSQVGRHERVIKEWKERLDALNWKKQQKIDAKAQARKRRLKRRIKRAALGSDVQDGAPRSGVAYFKYYRRPLPGKNESLIYGGSTNRVCVTVSWEQFLAREYDHLS